LSDASAPQAQSESRTPRDTNAVVFLKAVFRLAVDVRPCLEFI
jgi:hypothetical protein